VDCIIDASVGVKTIMREQWTENAEALLAGLRQDRPALVLVPDLFYAECGNVVWKRSRRYGFATTIASQGLWDLVLLPLARVPTQLLLPNAMKWALERDITVYDATYVALAELAELPLVTADERLVRKLEGSGIDVVPLADIGRA